MNARVGWYDELTGACTRQWVCVSEASSIAPPPAAEQPLITYKQFVDDAHPYKSLQGADGGSIEQIKAYNKCGRC